MQVLLPTDVLVPIGAGVLVVLVLLVALLVRAHRRRHHTPDVDDPDGTAAPQRPTVAHAVAIREADTAPLPISSATVLARSESARAAGAVPVEDMPDDVVVPDVDSVDASTTALPHVPSPESDATSTRRQVPESDATSMRVLSQVLESDATSTRAQVSESDTSSIRACAKVPARDATSTGAEVPEHDDPSIKASSQLPESDAASTAVLSRVPDRDATSTTALPPVPATATDGVSAPESTPAPPPDDSSISAPRSGPEVDAASTAAAPQLAAEEPQLREPGPAKQPADEGPDTAGSNVAFASAVSQVLAARAAAGRGPVAAPAEPPPPVLHAVDAPAPPPSKRGDTRDRLLAVLLEDPARAVGAARDLESCTTQLARLRAAVSHEREVLGTVLGRLSAAGLRPDQVAQLSGMESAELDRLLNRS